MTTLVSQLIAFIFICKNQLGAALDIVSLAESEQKGLTVVGIGYSLKE
jgi:hypothetical protein